MRPIIVLQLKTKHSCSHLCISCCHPKAKAAWGWGRHEELVRKNTQHAARKELGLPLATSGRLQEAFEHADTVTALEEGLGFSVSTQGIVIPHFPAPCYGLSPAPLLRERQGENPLVSSLGSIFLSSALCLMTQSCPRVWARNEHLLGLRGADVFHWWRLASWGSVAQCWGLTSPGLVAYVQAWGLEVSVPAVCLKPARPHLPW